MSDGCALYRFSGNITLSFGSGFSINILSTQLVLPEVGVDDHGAITANLSTREILMTPPQSLNFNDQIVLGIPFFTAAYLLVKYDQQPPTFSLWRANASQSSELIALDTDGSQCGAGAPVTSAPNSATSAPASSGGSTTATHSAVLTPGAIAGIAIGASVVVAAIVILWWWLARKRRGRTPNDTNRAGLMSSSETHSSLATKELPAAHGHTISAQEMSGLRSPHVQELNAVRSPPVPHQLYSLPNER